MTAALIGIPGLTAVNIRIPEGIFRLIVPEIIETIPGGIVRKKNANQMAFPRFRTFFMLEIASACEMPVVCTVASDMDWMG